MKNYGKELILDLHNCDIELFNRVDIDYYFKELCRQIDMKAEDRFWWDEEGVSEKEKQTNPKIDHGRFRQLVGSLAVVRRFRWDPRYR